MEKKTLRERVSRLQRIANLIEKLSIRFLQLLGPTGEWPSAMCVLAAVLAGYASLVPTGLCDGIASGASPAGRSADATVP